MLCSIIIIIIEVNALSTRKHFISPIIFNNTKALFSLIDFMGVTKAIHLFVKCIHVFISITTFTRILFPDIKLFRLETPIGIGCDIHFQCLVRNTCSWVVMTWDLFVYGRSCSSIPSIISLPFKGNGILNWVASHSKGPMVGFYLGKHAVVLRNAA